MFINAQMTKYMNCAYTGEGIQHKHHELLEQSAHAVFLKCLPTHSLSKLLQDTAADFCQLGCHVECFMNPAAPGKTEALYVREFDLFILQASQPAAFEPDDAGRQRVFCFYDIYDENKLHKHRDEVEERLKEERLSRAKALASLKQAKAIHDEWEQANIGRMDWQLHQAVIAELKAELFASIQLAKKAAVSHRIVGSLSADGAHDFIPSITKGIERRLLIKGLAGTGKSTMMRALGQEAEKRGIDVLYGWCGLDPSSIDLVSFPELSICLFDATKPHAYDPESPRDELMDLVPLCREDEKTEERINEISRRYKNAIGGAGEHIRAASSAQNAVKALMDSAIDAEKFEQKTQAFHSFIEKVKPIKMQ